jgi:hypothetical protein
MIMASIGAHRITFLPQRLSSGVVGASRLPGGLEAVLEPRLAPCG